MAVISTTALTHRYGRLTALRNVNLSVPEGSVFALLGPNGSGKTTLMQILMGMRRQTSGDALVFGKKVPQLEQAERARIGYVAEGLQLPLWMTLQQLAAYIAPLHHSWDKSLFAELRDRFQLELRRRLRTFSRGERMKAALLCALAARPHLLIMDEPFAGMDVVIRDELVQGLLQSTETDGASIVICSHDLSELETLVDGIAFLDRGELLLSASMDTVRSRFRKVEVFSGGDLENLKFTPPPDWLSVEKSGQRLQFVSSAAQGALVQEQVRSQLPDVTRIDERPATIREVFMGLAHAGTNRPRNAEAAI